MACVQWLPICGPHEAREQPASTGHYASQAVLYLHGPTAIAVLAR